MNILTDSPLISESPQESSARNLAIGQSFASSFLSGFNRGIERKREDERWAELKPLRDAQLAAQQAQVDAAKNQVQLQAIQVAKESMMKGKMAEFAALEGEIAFQEYSPEARVNFMGWLEKNPEFYGSQFHADVERRFQNAAKARADKSALDAEIKSRETVALIREAGSPQDEILSSDELSTLRQREGTEIRLLFNNAALSAQPEKLSQKVREVQDRFDKLRLSMREEKRKRLGLFGQKKGDGEAVLDPAPPGDGSVERIELDENGNVRVVNQGQMPKTDDGSGASNAAQKAPPVSSVRKDYSRAIVNPAKDTDADIIFKILGDRGIQDDESRRRIMQYLK